MSDIERVERDEVKKLRDAKLDAVRRIMRASEETGVEISAVELQKFVILLCVIEQGTAQ